MKEENNEIKDDNNFEINIENKILIKNNDIRMDEEHKNDTKNYEFVEIENIINNLKDDIEIENKNMYIESQEALNICNSNNIEGIKNESEEDMNKKNTTNSRVEDINLHSTYSNLKKTYINTDTDTGNNLNIENNYPKNKENNKFSTPIKTNFTKVEMNYENLFKSYTSSPFKNKIKSVLTVDDLTKHDTLLRKSTISHKDEFIKIEDLGFKDNIAELEENFSKVEIKINRGDVYNLYQTIKKCDLYSTLSKSDNQASIGPISTLEYMVESTFGFDNNLLHPISEHIISLEKHLFRWRSILGDGNCYYRAIMFAYLEKIVFEKNILLLKYIMTEINEKFDENYPNTRNLPNHNRQVINGLNKLLILKILYLIYEVLDQSNTNSNSECVQNAYEILIKSLIFCDAFDKGMVVYFRYQIYEFIKTNRNKVYTKDFAVNIGNLLPSQYETEYGDFLYDNFFEGELMKLDTDAEKIVIYLTPFVLKINVKIFIYEFDKDSNVLIRDFPCYLENKQDISLLYRKTHYDLIYDLKNFESNSKELCYFVNLNENLKVINNQVLDKLRASKFNTLVNTSIVSGINNKNDSKTINSNISSYFANSQVDLNKVNFSKGNINYNDQFTKDKFESIKNLNENIESQVFPICIFCNIPYLHKANLLNICQNCLNSELINGMMVNYLLYINECLAVYEEGREQNIPKIFNETFNIRNILVYNQPVTLSQLASFSNKTLKEHIKDVKSKICVICTTNIDEAIKKIDKNFEILKLPCSCIICSKYCLKYYFSLVFNKKRLEKSGAQCVCGYQFNTHDFKAIYEYLNKNNLKDYKKSIETFVMVNLSRMCMGGCMQEFRYSEKKFHLLVLKDTEFTKLYKIKEFKHVICEECFNCRTIREKELIECTLCNSCHKVEKIKKFISRKDNECNIL